MEARNVTPEEQALAAKIQSFFAATRGEFWTDFRAKIAERRRAWQLVAEQQATKPEDMLKIKGLLTAYAEVLTLDAEIFDGYVVEREILEQAKAQVEAGESEGVEDQAYPPSRPPKFGEDYSGGLLEREYKV